ncbi:hypothetical protein GMRT_12257 [Giardia muris]|uniref:Uncharacterized protein n=1 Tax=Giardia muris TaxID=5742 RepID=A0A4Z1T4J2_GIAMU|nr:hypothetical protein GMRT_12257 [Giardia muris]|eukprot:TNJ30588.1 hypothetical protein GMRT_12257 [Giardia muris]
MQCTNGMCACSCPEPRPASVCTTQPAPSSMPRDPELKPVPTSSTHVPRAKSNTCEYRYVRPRNPPITTAPLLSVPNVYQYRCPSEAGGLTTDEIKGRTIRPDPYPDLRHDFPPEGTAPTHVFRACDYRMGHPSMTGWRQTLHVRYAPEKSDLAEIRREQTYHSHLPESNCRWRPDLAYSDRRPRHSGRTGDEHPDTPGYKCMYTDAYERPYANLKSKLRETADDYDPCTCSLTATAKRRTYVSYPSNHPSAYGDYAGCHRAKERNAPIYVQNTPVHTIGKTLTPNEASTLPYLSSKYSLSHDNTLPQTFKQRGRDYNAERLSTLIAKGLSEGMTLPPACITPLGTCSCTVAGV